MTRTAWGRATVAGSMVVASAATANETPTYDMIEPWERGYVCYATDREIDRYHIREWVDCILYEAGTGTATGVINWRCDTDTATDTVTDLRVELRLRADMAERHEMNREPPAANTITVTELSGPAEGRQTTWQLTNHPWDGLEARRSGRKTAWRPQPDETPLGHETLRWLEQNNEMLVLALEPAAPNGAETPLVATIQHAGISPDWFEHCNAGNRSSYWDSPEWQRMFETIWNRKAIVRPSEEKRQRWWHNVQDYWHSLWK